MSKWWGQFSCFPHLHPLGPAPLGCPGKVQRPLSWVLQLERGRASSSTCHRRQRGGERPSLPHTTIWQMRGGGGADLACLCSQLFYLNLCPLGKLYCAAQVSCRMRVSSFDSHGYHRWQGQEGGQLSLSLSTLWWRSEVWLATPFSHPQGQLTLVSTNRVSSTVWPGAGSSDSNPITLLGKIVW